MTKKPLRILPVLAAAAIAAGAMTSCDDSSQDVDKKYKDWRLYNENWLIDQTRRADTDGTPYYRRCAMPTDPQGYVLMRNIGDVHYGNLQPLFTSTTKVNYTLTLVNDTVVDSGTGFVSQLSSSGYISGWSLSIMQLHVGDSAQFIVPYNMGYGTTETSTIPPYSNLKFNIRLVDITAYETRP